MYASTIEVLLASTSTFPTTESADPNSLSFMYALFFVRMMFVAAAPPPAMPTAVFPNASDTAAATVVAVI